MHGFEKQIILEDPFDAHVHFREGLMATNVAPYTSATFSGAMVMPNIDPPVTTRGRLRAYREQVEAATHSPGFKPYMTLYFQTDYTREFLEEMKDQILAIKFYPKGKTHNSQWGCNPEDPKVGIVLGYMQELGIPLSVHGEADGYYHDREWLFHEVLRRWIKALPGLQIIMEHITDQKSLRYLEQPNVYATVTVHHLLITGNDWVGPPLNPHLYCMPVAKRFEDMAALREAVFWDRVHRDKIMLGTDSAPHSEHNKLHCGCAGVFTAPIALQLLTDLFMEAGAICQLQNFVSTNAKRIYNLELPRKTVVLEKKPIIVPAMYDGNVVPMWAGRTIPWSIVEVK